MLLMMANLQRMLLFISLVLISTFVASYEGCDCEYDACRSIKCATKCEKSDVCQQLWKNGVWIKYKEDASSNCQKCLRNTILPLLNIVSNRDVRDYNDFSPEISCNLVDSCHSYTFSGKIKSSIDLKQCISFVNLISPAMFYFISNQEGAKFMIKSICSAELNQDSFLCKKATSSMIRNIHLLKENGFSANSICESLSIEEKEDKHLELTSFLQAGEVIQSDKNMFLFSNILKTPEQKVCDDCKKLVSDIKVMLADNATETAISNQIKEQICSVIPSSYEHYCDKFVDSQISNLINMIESYMDPSYICANLGLCDSVVKKVDLVDMYKDSEYLGSEQKVGLCDACAMVATSPVDIKTAWAKQVDAQQQHIINVMWTMHDRHMHEKKQLNICMLNGVCPLDLKSNSARAGVDLIPMKPSVDGDVCEDCKSLVFKVNKYLKDKKTRTEISELFQKEYCAHKPEKVKHCCEKFINLHVQAMIDLLLVHMHPRCICTAMGMCPWSRFDIQINQINFANVAMSEFVPERLQPSSTTCELCVDFIKDLRLDEVEGRPDETRASRVADEFCGGFPGAVSDICHQFVLTRTKHMMAQLKAGMTEETVCGMNNFCEMAPMDTSDLHVIKKLMNIREAGEEMSAVPDSAPMLYSYNHPPEDNALYSSSANRKPSTEVVAAATCQDCINVMQDIRKAETDPAIQKYLRDQILMNACQGAWYYKKVCTKIINMEFPKILSLVEALKPHQVCGFFGMCSPKEAGAWFYNPTTFLNLLDRQMQKDAVAILSPQDTGLPSFPIVCHVCEMVIHQVIELAGGNMTAHAIKVALEEVCLVVPSAEQNYCKEIVDKYAVSIVDAITKGATPMIACSALGLCGVISDIEEVKPVFEMSIVKPDENFDNCSLCKMVINYVYDQLKEKKTIEEIRRALENACHYIPYTSDQCMEFVDEYTDKIIEFVEKDVPAETVCAEIGLCAKPVVEEPICIGCEYIMKGIYDRLDSNATVVEITKVLDKICAYVPGSYGDTCKEMVDTYTQTVIRLIEDEMTPKEACQELGFCKSARMCFVENDERSKLCITKQRAQYCGHTEFCETMIWPKEQTKQPNDPCDKLSMDQICQSEVLTRICKRERECAMHWSSVAQLEYSALFAEADCHMCETVATAKRLQAEVFPHNTQFTYSCSIHLDAQERAQCEKVAAPVSESEQDFTKVEDIISWCKREDLCLQRQQPRVDPKCKLRTPYWCSSVEAAFSCGESKYSYCLARVWQKQLPSNEGLCAAGPSFYCQSVESAHQCNATYPCLKLPHLDQLPRDCAKGPGFWCSSPENRRACKAISYCAVRNPSSSTTATTPQSKSPSPRHYAPANCIGGPRVWCVNYETAKLCGKYKKCQSLGMPYSKTSASEHDCKRPAHVICRNMDLVKKCGVLKDCERNGFLNCSVGEEYFCENEETARKCGALDYCKNKGKFFTKGEEYKPTWVEEKRQEGVVMHPDCFSNDVVRCKSKEFARNCGIHVYSYCEENVWSTPAMGVDEQPSPIMEPRSRGVANDDYPCDQGPTAFCKDMETARGCGTVEYCSSYVWASTPEQTTTPRYEDYCSRGPAYYCRSMRLARKCDKVAFCITHVWS